MDDYIDQLSDEDHPLATQQFICPSHPMNRVCSSLKGAIKFNVPSLVISGERRYGKTTTVEFIAANTQLALANQYPTFFHRCRTPEPRMSESIFHSQLLQSCRHPMASTGTAEKKFERLLNKLFDLASTHRHRRIIIFFDEANRLTFREYNWLISIHNELEARGVKIVYVLTGQPELADRRSELLHEGATQITGRFMAQHISFSGLMSDEEVEYSAGQMDEALFWPDNGKCYSAFFAPKAYEMGWRYAEHATEIWDAFVTHSGARTKELGISMQSFVGVSGYLFRQKAGKKGFRRFSANDIAEAVEFIAYLEASASIELE